MRAGTLRSQIEIQEPVKSIDATGAPQKDWKTFKKVRAAIRQTTGRENWASGGETSEGNIRISIREMPDVPNFDPSWRLVDSDNHRIYDVVAVLPSRFGNDLTLACKYGGVRRS